MVAAKKKPGTAMTVWEQQMAQDAEAQASVETVGGAFKSISTRNGILSVDDTPVKGNTMDCIVLVQCHENQFYEGKFDPNVLSIPVCYAFGLKGAEGMKPHEDSSDPQHDQCEGCPNNEMGTADTGRGKACKNIRRLLLVAPDALDNPKAMEDAEARMLKVPVTSTTGWGKYVHKLQDEIKRPPYGVVTTISIVPDAKTQFKLVFEMKELIRFDQKLYDATQKRIAELSKEIVLPYQQPSEDAAPPARGARASKVAKRPAKAKPAPAKKPAARGRR